MVGSHRCETTVNMFGNVTLNADLLDDSMCVKFKKYSTEEWCRDGEDCIEFNSKYPDYKFLEKLEIMYMIRMSIQRGVDLVEVIIYNS